MDRMRAFIEVIAPSGGEGPIGITLPQTNLVYLYDPSFGVYSDAATTTPIADGGSVRAIKDRSTGAIHLTQAGAASITPTYRASVAEFNGKPALQFDGGDYLYSELLAPLLANQNIYTIYVVVKYSNPAQGRFFSEGYSGGGAGGGQQGIGVFASNANIRCWHVADNGTYTSHLISAAADNNNGVARLVVLRRASNTRFAVYVNNRMEAVDTELIPGTTTTDRLAMGTHLGATPSDIFTGHIALVAGYSADNIGSISPIIQQYFNIANPTYYSSAQKRFLCIGDSKTFGSGDTGYDADGGFGYPYTLAAGLTTATGEIWREALPRIGWSGFTVATMKNIIDTELAGVAGAAPSVVIVNLGTNDAGGLPAEATWKGNYRTLIASIHTKFPSAKILLSKPVRLSGNPPSSPVAAVATIHGWIDALVAEQTYLYAGADETDLEGGDSYVTNLSDSLHPNHVGYIALAGLQQAAVLAALA